jgi:hypothetical protein
MSENDASRLTEALGAQVHDGESYLKFGEMTREQVAAQGERLAEVGSWGPLARAAKVARAWKGLAAEMEQGGAATVADLDGTEVVTWAERVWAIAPAGGMI